MTKPPAEGVPKYKDSVPHTGEGADSAFFALLRRQRQKPGEPTGFQDTVPMPRPDEDDA
ncbi:MULTISPECIES: hypothetical protein [Ramlibacter]|uniref:Uncharacterized protein n=1 Tax=Ramlibacter pinisoli TaxID=2682844 RepID=A0A6N8IVN4_9BURK|nr:MULTISPECIES: hypothetical protein [Ramlibacter]MBA2961070.1 hypothetical protein [Ramlibacter sp. CGMCC 1.13660]MVQ31014.1 hypothetical protein [Ramlibacter pinisoli]